MPSMAHYYFFLNPFNELQHHARSINRYPAELLEYCGKKLPRRRKGQKEQKTTRKPSAIFNTSKINTPIPSLRHLPISPLPKPTWIVSNGFKQQKVFNFFVQSHPKHEKVPWATYQIAYAYTEAIPEDIPLMPKSYEKDQGATKSAIVAWDRFLRRFPKHEKVADAKKNRTKAREILAEQEWAVAKHYEDKERS